MESKKPLIPLVIWAQRSHVVYVTFCVDNAKDPIINIKRRQLTFNAFGGANNDSGGCDYYEICIPLYLDIDVINSVTLNNGRYMEVELQKYGSFYWPRLTLDDVKHHWLKIDFAKWMDEEEEIEKEVQEKKCTENLKNIQPKKKVIFTLGGSDDEDESEYEGNQKMQQLEIGEWQPIDEVSKNV